MLSSAGACRTLAIVLALAGMSGCGSGSSPESRSAVTPGTSPTVTANEDDAESPPAAEDEDLRESERRDAEIERHIVERERAAAAGDRDAVARAERELDRLAEEDTETDRPSDDDPYTRVVLGFPFKQAPLYVQQTESSSDHRLFVRVNQDAFCLAKPNDRLKAAAAVYAPADRQLRRDGVRDFEFILVPMTDSNPTEDDALAVGVNAQLRLTPKGRDC